MCESKDDKNKNNCFFENITIGIVLIAAKSFRNQYGDGRRDRTCDRQEHHAWL